MDYNPTSTTSTGDVDQRDRPEQDQYCRYPQELSGRISYTDAIVLCLRGEIPGPVESNVINAIFTAAMDHQFLNTTALAAHGGVG